MKRQQIDRIIGWTLLIASAAAVAAAFSLQILAGFALGVITAIGGALMVIGPDMDD